MPVLSRFASSILSSPLVGRSSSSPSSLSPGNATADEVLQVICAWPVSGQYGPGTRVLYYVLIATCLLARRAEWLVNACLAAALLLPAVAAIHGIVLAALHVDGAVDMDIFGAFQLCSIGILAAPVTVMLSQTYFNDPGRNTIFLWAILILVGLLCLAVEFYRIKTSDCMYVDGSNATDVVSPRPSEFPYDEIPTCGMRCSPEDGPFSSMRGGSADNVYVIPAPTTLTFGTGTLLAAACCLHALLCLVSMWSKVLEINWKRRRNRDEERLDEPIEGTNGATEGTMRSVNGMIRHFLSMVAIPVFGGAGIAILILGEINFFSKQVRHQTEPMASVGQWAPVVGTGMAMIGSLYLLLARDVEAVKQEGQSPVCKCPHYHPSSDQDLGSHLHFNVDPKNRRSRSASGSPQRHARGCSSSESMRPSVTHDSGVVPSDAPAQDATAPNQASGPSVKAGAASRVKVARFLVKMGKVLGSPPQGFMEDEILSHGKATAYPVTPGEEGRNENLEQTMHLYDEIRSNSQAPSILDSDPSTPRTTSPQRSQSPRPRASTLPVGQTPSEARSPPSRYSDSSTANGKKHPSYGMSLQVPPQAHRSHARDTVHARTSRWSSSPAMGRRASSSAYFNRPPADGASRVEESISLSPLSGSQSVKKMKEPAPD